MKFNQVSNSGHIEKYSIDSPLSYKLFFMKIKSDINFRTLFISILSKSAFPSYRFETPPVNSSNVDKSFEFVLINSPELSDIQDSVPFEEHMNKSNDSIISFLNLSKSSELIVPNIKSNENVYSHLAQFVRKAPTQQVHELLKVVSTKMLESINTQNIWLSTAGAGVDWLHVRIDKKPKYYKYKNYKTY